MSSTPEKAKGSQKGYNPQKVSYSTLLFTLLNLYVNYITLFSHIDMSVLLYRKNRVLLQ